MAFTTQTGTESTDAITLLGSAAVDTIDVTAAFEGNYSANVKVEGLAAADVITVSRDVDDYTAKGGDGNDSITFSGSLGDSFVNGNSGNDTLGFATAEEGSTKIGRASCRERV